MSSDRTGDTRKARRRPRWARWLVGCLAALLLLCCVGIGTFGYGVYWVGRGIHESLQAISREEMDRILAGGDADTIWEKAAPSFRARCSREEWHRFLAEHPGIFDRSTLEGGLTSTRSWQNHTYRLVQVNLPGGKLVKLVFQLVRPTMVLLGIWPLLDAAPPAGLLEAFARPAPSRGRGIIDLFD